MNDEEKQVMAAGSWYTSRTHSKSHFRNSVNTVVSFERVATKLIEINWIQRIVSQYIKNVVMSNERDTVSDVR